MLHAELVDMICQAAETGAWEVFGIKSLPQWVAWQTGLSPARARQIVTIAERRAELPVSFDAFAAGRVAVDQMVTVAAKVPPAFDAQAAELAQLCTVTQLGRAFNKHAFPQTAIAAIGEPVTPVAERDYVSYGTDDHGRFRLTLACDALQGAVIVSAIDEARDALFTAGHTDVTLIDTIVELAQRSLATVGTVSRTDRYRVLVHLDITHWQHGGQTNTNNLIALCQQPHRPVPTTPPPNPYQHPTGETLNTHWLTFTAA